MKNKLIIFMSTILLVSLLSGCGGSETLKRPNTEPIKDKYEEIPSYGEEQKGKSIKEYDSVERNDKNDKLVLTTASYVNEKISKYEKKATSDGFQERQALIENVALELSKVYEKGRILDYGYNTGCAWYINLYGTIVIYTPPSERFLSEGDELCVKTYEPSHMEFAEGGHIIPTDTSAEYLTQVFSNYVLTKNLDDSDVTLEELFDFGPNEIIFWDGHGARANGTNYLVTGVGGLDELDVLELEKKYDVSLGLTITGRVAVGQEFIEKYVPDMTNSFIYLNTCYSAQDTGGVSGAFVDKGAVVVGHTDSVYVSYANGMFESIIELLCQANGERLVNLEEAILEARTEWGDDDIDWIKKQFGAVPEKDKDRVGAAVVCSDPDFTLPMGTVLQETAEESLDTEIAPYYKGFASHAGEDIWFQYNHRFEKVGDYYYVKLVPLYDVNNRNVSMEGAFIAGSEYEKQENFDTFRISPDAVFERIYKNDLSFDEDGEMVFNLSSEELNFYDSIENLYDSGIIIETSEGCNQYYYEPTRIASGLTASYTGLRFNEDGDVIWVQNAYWE